MTGPVRSVLFACNLNRVRSPRAAGLVRRRYGLSLLADSCGLHAAVVIPDGPPVRRDAVGAIGHAAL